MHKATIKKTIRNAGLKVEDFEFQGSSIHSKLECNIKASKQIRKLAAALPCDPTSTYHY